MWDLATIRAMNDRAAERELAEQREIERAARYGRDLAAYHAVMRERRRASQPEPPRH